MGLAEGDSWGGAVAVRSSASIAAVSAMVDIPVAEDHGIVIGLESSGIIRRFELCVILVILYKALDEGFVKGGVLAGKILYTSVPGTCRGYLQMIHISH